MPQTWRDFDVITICYTGILRNKVLSANYIFPVIFTFIKYSFPTGISNKVISGFSNIGIVN